MDLSHTFKVATAICGKPLRKAGSDPGGRSNPRVQMAYFRGDLGDDLDATAAGSNDRDPLAFEVESFRKIGTMLKHALERVKTVDVRPLPIAVDHLAVVRQG